jgi:hypothetical protein
MGQQGISDFKYPQLINLSRYNDVTNIPYDPASTDGSNVSKFNQQFEANKSVMTARNQEIGDQKLQIMSKQSKIKKPYQQSFLEVLIGVKDTWFGLIDDILQQRFYMETFNKDNRLFYIGVTIVLIVILIYLYYMIFDDCDSSGPNKKVYEIHYIHHKE